MFNHKDARVNQALVELTDALCTWERETGRKNVLILREVDGFCFRAFCGKATIPPDLLDREALALVAE